MDSDEEDFVFYGTPIEREEDITTRKKKAIAEASGQLRSLPPWKQEVRDEEGRRRFHGAFTGGYSAGFFNTVGSKEGWTPQSFTSSRKNRADIKQQSIYNFMDEDEKAELEGQSLGTSMQFDTFGFTADELARKQAQREQLKRPSAIPGPLPDEIVVPATESIGIKLLLKMGWRRGRSIKDSSTNSLYDIRREARKAFLALSANDTAEHIASSELVQGDFETVTTPINDDSTHQSSKSTPVYVLNPKQDLHGLGYDPFKHAPEFREKKRSRTSGPKEISQRKPFSMGDSLFGFKSGKVAPGFGIGALEDLDVEDEDVYGAGYDFEETYVEEIDEPSRPMLENVERLDRKKGDGVLPGFKAASNIGYLLERFDPPEVPRDFVPHHKFASPLVIRNNSIGPVPTETPPPDDNNLKILIDGMATLVARCGRLFEDLSREKNGSNPLFAFLSGGNGHDYYARKLWEERQKHTDQTKQQSDGQMFPNVEKMTAESRGKILGERPLERSIPDASSSLASAEAVNLSFSLSDTFTKPASLTEIPEVVKPFQEDTAKQERFEQFLKEKYLGGLRSKDAGGASKMSEADRARERLEFEAAAEVIEKGKHRKEAKTPAPLFSDALGTSGLQFTSGVLEPAKVRQDERLTKREKYPKREEFQWRPSPILCKRFDLIDPYMGKPPPAPRSRSKLDGLIFMPEPVIPSRVEENVRLDRDLSSSSKMGSGEKGKGIVDEEMKVDVEVENVERPVDLYKAIFSDDSDEDEEIKNPQVEDPQKKIEVANTTLNRLIAGDFLESLGKELGLEVPPDLPYMENKDSGTACRKETKTANHGEKDVLLVGNNRSTTDYSVGGSLMNAEVGQTAKSHHDILQEGSNNEEITNRIRAGTNGMPVTGTSNFDENVAKMEKKPSGAMQRHRNWSSDSSEDERNRNHSRHRHRRRRSINSDSDASDSSGEYQDRRHSRSKGKKNKSSKEKSSSRRSKHHKHKYRDSSDRDSCYSSRKEHGEARRERHKYKD